MSDTSIIDIPNESGKEFRLDSNTRAESLATMFAGASEPEIVGAGQLWADTGTHYLKIRSEDNSSWITLLPINANYIAPVNINGGAVMNNGLFAKSRLPLELLADDTSIQTVYSSDLNNILDNGIAVISSSSTVTTLKNLPTGVTTPFVLESFKTSTSNQQYQRLSTIEDTLSYTRHRSHDDGSTTGEWYPWNEADSDVTLNTLGAATSDTQLPDGAAIQSWFASQVNLVGGFYFVTGEYTQGPTTTGSLTFAYMPSELNSNGTVKKCMIQAWSNASPYGAYVLSMDSNVWGAWNSVYNGGGGVSAVNGHTGNVTLTPSDLGLTVTTSYDDTTAGRIMKVGDFNIGKTQSTAITGFDFSTYVFAMSESKFIQMSSAKNVPDGLSSLVYAYIHVIACRDSINDYSLVVTNYDDPGDSYIVTKFTASSVTYYKVSKIADVLTTMSYASSTLSSGTNPKSLYTPGNYYQSGSSLALTSNGYPWDAIHTAFLVAGLPTGDGTGHATIALSNDNESPKFAIHCSGGSDNSSNWFNVYTEANKPTAAIVGALPISGGTTTGNITLGKTFVLNGLDSTGTAQGLARFDSVNNEAILGTTTYPLVFHTNSSNPTMMAGGTSYTMYSTRNLTLTSSTTDHTSGHVTKVGDFNFGLVSTPPVKIDFNAYDFANGEILHIETVSGTSTNIPSFLSGYSYVYAICIGANDTNNDCTLLFNDKTDGLIVAARKSGVWYSITLSDAVLKTGSTMTGQLKANGGIEINNETLVLKNSGGDTVVTLDPGKGVVSPKFYTNSTTFEFANANNTSTQAVYFDIHTNGTQTNDYDYRINFESTGDKITFLPVSGKEFTLSVDGWLSSTSGYKSEREIFLNTPDPGTVDDGTYVSSPGVTLMLEGRGAYDDTTGAYGVMYYEEHVGVDNAICLKADGFGGETVWRFMNTPSDDAGLTSQFTAPGYIHAGNDITSDGKVSSPNITTIESKLVALHEFNAVLFDTLIPHLPESSKAAFQAAMDKMEAIFNS